MVQLRQAQALALPWLERVTQPSQPYLRRPIQFKSLNREASPPLPQRLFYNFWLVLWQKQESIRPFLQPLALQLQLLLLIPKYLISNLILQSTALSGR
ncbi:hypothetical protein [Chromobacterium sp. LK1]|uniref:hypothetical protein n=1 Tax=Chromobacterium sp. LK1 TaxID=1628193 RepID=UPI001E457855|nr:hypothetical protein [Chromobacterium sp. LK1]